MAMGNCIRKYFLIFKIIIIISISPILIGCESINKYFSSIKVFKNKKMELFDYEKYNELKNENSNFYFANDSTKIEFEEFDDVFSQQTINVNTLFSTIKNYNKVSKLLESETLFFQSNPIGVSEKFDSDGNVINQINYDSFFPYTLDQLHIDFISNYNINIFDINQKCNVIRESDIEPFPYYQISQPLENGKLRFFFVNGINGNVISEEYLFQEDSEDE